MDPQVEAVVKAYFSYRASVVLALCSLALALIWPAAAVLLTRNAAGLDFAIQLGIGWVSPVVLAVVLWPIRGDETRVLIPLIAVVYLLWTLLTFFVLVGILYLPAAGFLLWAAVARAVSPPTREGSNDTKRPPPTRILL